VERSEERVLVRADVLRRGVGEQLVRPPPVLEVRGVPCERAPLRLRLERHDHRRDVVDALAARLAAAYALLLAECTGRLCGAALRNRELHPCILSLADCLNRAGQVRELEALREVEAEAQLRVQERRSLEEALTGILAVHQTVDALHVRSRLE